MKAKTTVIGICSHSPPVAVFIYRRGPILTVVYSIWVQVISILSLPRRLDSGRSSYKGGYVDTYG